MANELYRQSIHLICGITAAISAVYVSRTAFLSLWGVLVFACILAIIFAPPSAQWLWRILERPDVVFKGKGGLFFLVGIWLTGFVFWDHATGAIMLLAVPDALATVLSPLRESPRLLWNHRKTMLGSSVFLLSAMVILLFFTSFVGAFLIALLLAAIESFDYREIPFLDDNLVIPLVAGFLLQFA